MLNLCSSFLLTCFSCSGIGSLPQKSPSWASPTSVQPQFFKNYLTWVLSVESSPSGRLLQYVFPFVVTSPARNPASSWGLLHGLQFQPGPCSSLGFPQATATFIYFSAYACAEAWCPPQDAVWMSATYHGLPWAAWGQPVSPCVSPHMVSREGHESLWKVNWLLNQSLLSRTIKWVESRQWSRGTIQNNFI